MRLDGGGHLRGWLDLAQESPHPRVANEPGAAASSQSALLGRGILGACSSVEMSLQLVSSHWTRRHPARRDESTTGCEDYG